MLAHVHIMKTAGQTVCDIMRRSFGSSHCDLRCGDLATVADVQFARRFYPNLQSIAGHSIRPWSDLKQIDGLRFFTFLREPVSRCLSHYQFEKVKNNNSLAFLPWLEQNSNYQTRILCGEQNVDAAIAILESRVEFVGFVEAFDESLQLLRRWSCADLALNYRSRNVASSGTIKDAVLSEPGNAEAAAEFNRMDRIVYHYARNEIYPRLKAEFAQTCDERSQHGRQSALPAAWATAKRGLLYKPAAKIRERWAA